MARKSLEDSQQPSSAENSQNVDDLFSPRFKSVAATAGWDEEALVTATLIAEDTPDRQRSKHKPRSDSIFNTTPCSISRRKRRVQRRSPVSTPIAPLNLEEEEEISKQESEKKTKVNEPSPLHCIDKLREELSFAICLDICFEPSTTPCGHSFCKKCLRSAADKCGRRCPKCRQLMSNGRSCTVNTVLWNTIQLLFPKEVEARKAAGALNSSEEVECRSQESRTRSSTRRTQTRARVQDPAMASSPQREDLARLVNTNTNTTRRGTPVRQQRENDLSWLVSTGRRRRGTPGQDEDAALALRLQREEFMEAFRGSSGHDHQQERIPLSLARENFRAMASRAVNGGRC
ncbi:putative ubiquitin-protein ligase [Hibiscus syriacus]|uniref:RING-type E3 ubiquitin transferase n=1 Tax=Hibiscus syriacus TaxID=106335 RepID=A0A6A3ANT2_HIBSY|nr:LON peptidase N-terminal domain and RING finger protein 3-like [Hibiscus syriacus]KAE8706274.1 putative ubiquitin-protein ligase [Hibiscus syriacus]